MTDSLRFFLALLATTPAVAAFFLAVVFFQDEIVDIVHALQVWLWITVALAVLVAGIAGLYYVWTWAV